MDRVPAESPGPSRRSSLRALVGIVGGFAIALVLGIAYTTYLDPVVVWLRELDEIKAEAARRVPSPRTVLAGGSSTVFGIDPTLLTQLTGRRAFNVGNHAGLGAPFLLDYGASFAQASDTLIISIEPILMSRPSEPTHMGNQLAFLMRERLRDGQFVWVDRKRWLPHRLVELERGLAAASPSLRRLVGHAGRVALGRETSAYQSEWVDSLGYSVEKVDWPHGVTYAEDRLDPQWHDVLRSYRDRQLERGVTVIYLLPWREVPDGMGAHAIDLATELLDAINADLPVLLEADCGIKEGHPEWFADTTHHLSKEGARLRTKSLAAALGEGRIVEPGGGVPPGCHADGI